MSIAFELGFARGIKLAAEAPKLAPYLQGHPNAEQQVAGPVQSQPQPWPGHVALGNKSPGQQVAGPVAKHLPPDTGERGSLAKSAAFQAGVCNAL